MKHVATTHADVFSFGIVLAEMIHPCGSFMEREQVSLLLDLPLLNSCSLYYDSDPSLCSSSANFTLKLSLN